MDMHGSGSGGCKMQKVHPHESRCLRRRQYRLIFIPSTLSCALGPASRQDKSNLTLLQSLYQSINFFHSLLRSIIKLLYVLDIQKPHFVR